MDSILKKKKIFFYISLALVSVVLSLFLSEFMLRAIDFSYPTLFRLSESRGTEHYPGAEGWVRAEGEGYVKLNKDGMRGLVHTKEKPADTVRIAILGDSFAEAFNIPIEKTFWGILEKELNQCRPFGEKNIEVINFSSSGYGTAQELMTLRDPAIAYDPDIALLAMFLGNDIRNNSKVLEPEKLRPFFSMENGILALDDSFKHSNQFKAKTSMAWEMILFVSKYSRTIQFLNKIRHRMGVSKENRDKNNAHIQLVDSKVFFEPESKEWQEAWEVTENLILRIRDEAWEKGTKLFITTLSAGIQVHSDSDVWKDFIKDINLTDLFYPDKRIKRFAVKNGIPHIILAPELAAYAKKTGEFVHGFENYKMGVGHWNETGHRLAGNLIAEQICKHGV